MIREASVYALKRLSQEARVEYGYRVLVMRRWPQGIRWQLIDAWLPAAGPTPQMLHDWQQGRMSWPDFERIYTFEQEMLSSCTLVLPDASRQEYQGRAVDLLLDLEQQHGTVSVLCHEAQAPCHRFTLQALVEHHRHGQSVPTPPIHGTYHNLRTGTTRSLQEE